MFSIYIMVVSFLITFSLLLWIIEIQKEKRVGQVERVEGLESHKKKNNTPTLGGIAFVVVTVLVFTVMLFVKQIDAYIYLLIIIPFVSYGLLGLTDDLLILKKGKNDGLNPALKFSLQIIIAVIYFIIYLKFNFDTKIDLLFMVIDLKFLYGIFILLSFVGISNATNLTDGIDGLLGGITTIFLISFYVMSDTFEIDLFIGIFLSCLIAFLYFNLPKAKIFMGNIGALAIGGVIVSISIILKLEIFLFIIGAIYIIEALSVILQVGYFKLTKGKRLFKMAPIHHHFEIVLKSEIKTLVLFYIVEIILSIIGLLIFFNL